ncbi:helix-turn-helix transcriptional regulator [Fulvivirga kasyanovii]|uniref:helix-turn-helix domain-containing protein n=1 Tax=Fulvivirga kasyanovii TaxID=396812 RepID=UPI0031D0857F
MTRLGEYMAKKSASKAHVAKKTGFSKSRISELTLNTSTKLRADELYLIALALDVNPCELLEFVCGHLKLSES